MNLNHDIKTNAICPECGQEVYLSDNSSFSFKCHHCGKYFNLYGAKTPDCDYFAVQIPITNHEYHEHYNHIDKIVQICKLDILSFDDTRSSIEVGWCIKTNGKRRMTLIRFMQVLELNRLLNQFLSEIHAKEFKSDLQAVEYGLENDFGKHEFEKIKVRDEDVILCGTNQAVEENLWGSAYEIVKEFCERFGPIAIEEDDYSDFATDLASKIRDLVIKEYEEEHKVRFINVWDEY